MKTPVRIRTYRPEDVEGIYSAVMASRRELSEWMPWCHETYSRQDTTGWVSSRTSAWERNVEWSFLIIDGDETVVGGCGLHRLDLKNGVAELGYWVRTESTGQGVATEATRQLCQWAFQDGGLERIEILASVDNRASQRVAEKVGGVREGVLRRRIRLGGRSHDCILYSILKKDLRH
ncbi:GNAT family N-acetyltransferase [Schlesneria sp. T3-172]|uniref:GNAT family N-acetyltransferase n=1 Tax=Schlesneria sphaerica TaxID=3373610 RepID=UPI0037C80066